MAPCRSRVSRSVASEGEGRRRGVRSARASRPSRAARRHARPHSPAQEQRPCANECGRGEAAGGGGTRGERRGRTPRARLEEILEEVEVVVPDREVQLQRRPASAARVGRGRRVRNDRCLCRSASGHRVRAPRKWRAGFVGPPLRPPLQPTRPCTPRKPARPSCGPWRTVWSHRQVLGEQICADPRSGCAAHVANDAARLLASPPSSSCSPSSARHSRRHPLGLRLSAHASSYPRQPCQPRARALRARTAHW